MISLRYIPAVCVLVALVLVPTVIHSYVGATVADHLTTASIAPALAGFTSVKSERDPSWGERRFESTDWLERRYSAPGDEALLTVIRSYDLKRVYHHPELDVAYGTGFLREETRRFAAAPHIPVRVLYTDVESGPLGLYALHYGDGFVDNPLLFQVRSAFELLVAGRRPMTLFFVRDTQVPPNTEIEGLPSLKLLLAAIESFAGGTSSN